MKTKVLFFALFLIGSFSAAKAQYVDQTPISELNADYMKVWSDLGPVLSSKITVAVDYGQGGRNPQITDERRRPMTFTGMIAVLNMMSKNGFELVEIIRSEKDDQEYYLLRRKNSRTYEQSGTVDYIDDNIHQRNVQ